MKPPASKQPSGAAPALPEAARDAEYAAIPSGLVAEWPWARVIDRILGIAPAAILFAMMVLTFVNVVLRYGFRQPISGALEIMSYMMGLLVFLSLPLVTARAEHVRISLLDGIVPMWLRQVRIVFFNLVMAGVCYVVGWRLWLFGDRLARWGESTQMYGLPLYTLSYIMAACTYLCMVLFVLTAVRAFFRRDFVARAEF
ncbi:MAG: TRAP transporter small permease [Rhodobacteraceae bacterium]|nr:TRAP transporter small permease [Paracoccaceae bacterium]